MKRFLSILLILCTLVGIQSIGVMAADINYPFTIEKYEYSDEGTIKVTAKGSGATIGAIRITFFQETKKIMSKNVTCQIVSHNGNKIVVKGTLDNSTIPNGNYQVSIALLKNDGTTGEKLTYYSDYKMQNVTITNGAIETDILRNIITSIITGTTQMQVTENITLYSDMYCTQPTGTVTAGTVRDPVLVDAMAAPELQSNIVAIRYNNNVYYTYSENLAEYEITQETVTEDEKRRFVQVANNGVYRGSWETIGNEREYNAGNRIIINDVESGKYWAAIVVSNGNCMKIEPATTDDANIYKNIVGKWENKSRPVWIYSRNKIYAASVSCSLKTPKINTSVNNGLDGYFDLFFNGCTNDRGMTVAAHNNTVNTAYNRGKNL